MNTSLTIRNQVSVSDWESFLQAQPFAPFLQSSHMEQLHATLGDRTWRMGVYDNEILIGVCFAVMITARRGWHLYIPYGPVFAHDQWGHLPVLMAHVKALAIKENADFIRCSPFLTDTSENANLFGALGFRKSPIHVLAEHLWMLDIRPSEQELLAGMRKTMRNLIRKAEKEGVTITTSQDPQDIEKFITVHQDTVSRHGFTPYTGAYFRAQAESFLPDNLGTLYFAHYEGKIISSAFIMYYGDTGSYHHGASLSEYNKIPASYLLQWRAILEARTRGKTKYNFWGIVPESKQISPVLKRPHPWIGLSKFKMGFGGSEYTLLHCQDLPLTPKYLMTYIIETIRRIKRGQ